MKLQKMITSLIVFISVAMMCKAELKLTSIDQTFVLTVGISDLNGDGNNDLVLNGKNDSGDVVVRVLYENSTGLVISGGATRSALSNHSTGSNLCLVEGIKPLGTLPPEVIAINNMELDVEEIDLLVEMLEVCKSLSAGETLADFFEDTFHDFASDLGYECYRIVRLDEVIDSVDEGSELGLTGLNKNTRKMTSSSNIIYATNGSSSRTEANASGMFVNGTSPMANTSDEFGLAIDDRPPDCGIPVSLVVTVFDPQTGQYSNTANVKVNGESTGMIGNHVLVAYTKMISDGIHTVSFTRNGQVEEYSVNTDTETVNGFCIKNY